MAQYAESPLEESPFQIRSLHSGKPYRDQRLSLVKWWLVFTIQGLRLADDDEPYVWVSGEEADSSESSGSFGHSLKQGCTALGAPSSQTFWKAEAFEGYTAAVTQTSRLVCLETPTSPGEVQRAVPMPTVALKNMIPEW